MKLKSWESISLGILSLFVIIVVVLQIILSGPNTTKLETILFSILQFILSLAFTWLLSRVSLKNEFIKSQKTFAISAYRRIYEINLSVERLISRTSLHIQNSNGQENHELDVITEIAIGIHESIRSSISDWAEIIGDEIEKIEKIDQLREEERERIFISTNLDHEKKIETELVKLSSQIDSISDSLPTQLRILTTKNPANEYQEKLNRARRLILREKEIEGFAHLDCMCIKGYGRQIGEFKKGEIFKVRIGDYSFITKGILVIYSKNDEPVGAVMNKFIDISTDALEASRLLCSIFGSYLFEVELLDNYLSENEKRILFRVRVI